MTRWTVLPLAWAFALAACGGGERTSAPSEPGDGHRAAQPQMETDLTGDTSPDSESASGTPCEGQLDFSESDDKCSGNVGCEELGVECGECTCTLCWNDDCLIEVCDDGGSDECAPGPWGSDGMGGHR